MASGKTQYELLLEINGKLDKSFSGAAKGAQKQLDSLSSCWKKLAGVAAAGIAAFGVGSFLGDAVDTYKDFEKSMSNTAAIADASETDYKKLEDAAREMGKATTKTAAEAADALGYMALAGWDVDDSIQALEPVLRLSEATSMDLATCSDLVTDSMSALGVTVDDLSDYLDIAAKANNKSNQSAQQLMEAYLGVGGTLTGLGVELEESATALGVMANRGIKGSEAGNALNAVLVNLTTGTGQAGEMMEKLGISAFDSQGKFIGVAETLQKVEEATSSMTDEQRNAALAAIGGKQHIDALNALMAGLTTTTADGTTEWAALEKELQNASGALDTMAAKSTDNLAGSLARLESAADDLKIELVSAFAPSISKGIEYLASSVVPKLSQGLGWISQKLAPVVEKYGPKVQVFLEKAESGLSVLWGKAQPVLSAMSEKLARLWPPFLSGAQAMWGKVQPILSALGTAFSQNILPVLQNIGERFGPMLGKIGTAMGGVLGFIADKIPAAIELTGSALSGLYDMFAPALEGIGNLITGFVEMTAGIFSGDWQKICDGIGDAFIGAFQVIGGAFRFLLKPLFDGLNALIDGLNGIHFTVPDWVPVIGGNDFGFNIPKLPELAAGGIAAAPTLAMIGEGSEPEAVLPLSRLADMLPEGLPKGGDSSSEVITFAPVFNFYGGTPDEAGAKKAAALSFAEFKRLYRQMKAEERRVRFSMG